MKDFLKRILSSKPIKYQRQPKYGPVYDEKAKYLQHQASISNAIMQLESSGGTNRTNADPGEKEWMYGMTPIAIEELKRVGRLSPTYDRNNQEEVRKASLEYFNLMKENNPEKSEKEVYTDKYWTQATSNEQRQKKMDEFDHYVNTGL